jgi:hypothetical protein
VNPIIKKQPPIQVIGSLDFESRDFTLSYPENYIVCYDWITQWPVSPQDYVVVFGLIPEDLESRYEDENRYSLEEYGEAVHPCMSEFFQAVMTLLVYPEESVEMYPEEVPNFTQKDQIKYSGESIEVIRFPNAINGDPELMNISNGYLTKRYKSVGVPGFYYNAHVKHNNKYYYFISPMGSTSSRYMNKEFLDILNTFEFNQ